MILSTLLKRFQHSSFEHAKCLRALTPVSKLTPVGKPIVNLETVQRGYLKGIISRGLSQGDYLKMI